MPHWHPFHGWMAFDSLDENGGLSSSYTIGYRFTDDDTDDWTHRFNRFKEKRVSALLGGLKLMKVAVPILVHNLGLDPSQTVFVPALSSKETVASKKGVLGVITSHIAESTHTRVLLEAITKKAHDPLHNVYRADRRREILDEAGYTAEKIKAKNVLIFDDFITRGDTLSHIAQAIHNANRGITVYGIGLAKTERIAYHRRLGIELSNQHIPENWRVIWEEGETEHRTAKTEKV